MASEESDSKNVIIYVDGASSGNPGPGGWGAIVGYLEDSQIQKGIVIELGGAEKYTTNNRMELTAAIRALEKALEKIKDQDDCRIEIYTDSTYVIRGITQWIYAWKKKGWKTAEGNSVSNVDLWEELSRLNSKRKVYWNYVPGHQGIPGNERADAIAVGFSQGRAVSLYQGVAKEYFTDLFQKPKPLSVPENNRGKKGSAKTPYSYLSLVGNSPMRHKNWNDCEKRVKGASGAKFKKAMSEEEEKAILDSWGFQFSDLRDS